MGFLEAITDKLANTVVVQDGKQGHVLTFHLPSYAEVSQHRAFTVLSPDPLTCLSLFLVASHRRPTRSGERAVVYILPPFFKTV